MRYFTGSKSYTYEERVVLRALQYAIVGAAVAVALAACLPSRASSRHAALRSFAPASGVVGQKVIITGAGFKGARAVQFNGVPAGFVVNTDTQITATVPLSATSGNIRVATRAGGVWSATVFRVQRAVSANAASYVPRTSGSVQSSGSTLRQ